MEESLSTAITLLAVGMITVFTILALIVVIGNLLIIIVNKFFPEKLPPVLGSRYEDKGSSDPRILAAIITTVDVITRGKGSPASIEKDGD